MTIHILIADDHILLRAGLHALLNSIDDFEVVGEASNGAEVQQRIKESKPDVVLMDINMPDSGGIEATRQLQQTNPEVKILILTAHEDKSLLQEALNAGASGYILKRVLESELTTAIRAVARGDFYVHPAMTHALLSSKEETPADEPNLTGILTPREIEVLRLLANGHTNGEIARMLTIGVRTVESHRSNLMSKLDIYSRAALVRCAIKNDLLQGEES